MANSPNIRLKGLYTFSNPLGEVPKGALAIADNIVLDADGSVQSRRGFDTLAETVGTLSSRVNKLFTYQSQLLAHYDSGTLAYRNIGTGWSAYTGTFSPIDAATCKVRSAESNSNFYFTTSNGVYKLDSYTGTPVLAGGLKGLDVKGTLVNAGSGFMINNSVLTTTANTHTTTTIDGFTTTAGVLTGMYVSGSGIPNGTTVISIVANTSVTLSQAATSTLTATSIQFYSGAQTAYRIVWGFKDANNNLILGTPSQRSVVANVTANSSDVSLQITVPTGATVNHLFQVYRAPTTVNATTEPSDEMQLVYEGNPTVPQISALSITLPDSTSDSLKGAYIYTASSQDGILQSNEVPPLAKDVAFYRNLMLYANVTSRQRLKFTLLAAGGSSGVQNGDVVTIAGTAYTANGVQTTGTLNGTITVTVTSATGISIGQTVVGTGIQTGTTVANVVSTTVTLSLAANAGTVGSPLSGVTLSFYKEHAATNGGDTNTFAVILGGTPSQNIRDTANSLVRVINQSVLNTLVNAFYVSAYNDLPGKLNLEGRNLGTSAFTVQVSANPKAYDPQPPVAGNTVISTQDIYKNAIMVSKTGQPEAVPLTSIFYVGSAAYGIDRIIPLRDSVFIFKQDGIFKLVGQTVQNFYVDSFDNTTKLIAPETAINLNNTIYCLSDQGVVSVSDTGISVVSRPIEGDLLTLLGANLTNIQNLSFGISYQSDRKYIIGVITNSGDANVTQLYVYNLFTNAWTRWPLAKTHGIVNPADNKLYFADAVTNTVNSERKSYSYLDYVDGTFATAISASAGTSVTLTDLTNLAVGDLLYQSYTVKSVVTAINVSANTATVQDSVSWSNAAATIYKAITCTIKLQPQTGDSPETLKQFSEIELFFRKARFNQALLSFTSDLSASTDSITLMGVNNGSFGLFTFGGGTTVPFGGSRQAVPLRTYVPKFKQRCSQLNITFTHRVAYGDFILDGINLKERAISDNVTR